MTSPAPAPLTAADLDRIRRDAFKEAAKLLTLLAEDAERYGQSAMGRLYEMAKAEAYRDAARRVGDLR